MEKNTGKKKTSKAFPVCDMHRNCFANKEGHCVCLSDNDFGNKDCPFYKPDTVTTMDEIRVACKAYAETHSGLGKE